MARSCVAGVLLGDHKVEFASPGFEQCTFGFALGHLDAQLRVFGGNDAERLGNDAEGSRLKDREPHGASSFGERGMEFCFHELEAFEQGNCVVDE